MAIGKLTETTKNDYVEQVPLAGFYLENIITPSWYDIKTVSGKRLELVDAHNLIRYSESDFFCREGLDNRVRPTILRLAGYTWMIK